MWWCKTIKPKSGLAVECLVEAGYILTSSPYHTYTRAFRAAPFAACAREGCDLKGRALLARGVGGAGRRERAHGAGLAVCPIRAGHRPALVQRGVVARTAGRLAIARGEGPFRTLFACCPFVFGLLAGRAHRTVSSVGRGNHAIPACCTCSSGWGLETPAQHASVTRSCKSRSHVLDP